MDPAAPAPAFFDSLPYYDDDLEKYPILRERVQHELAVETQKLQQGQKGKLHPSLSEAREFFNGRPLIESEMQRVEAKQPLNAIDTARFTLPTPGADATEEEWKAAVDNARVQLEHQKIRHHNLALLQQYGANAWRVHNYLLEADAKVAEKLAEGVKEETTGVNRERKNGQTRIGNQLTSLESQWQQSIGNNLQLTMANAALEAETHRLRMREQELSSMLYNK
ncbi:unnamed protein product [Peniophora sp. CBMAI 1063]|nr:unnamed protein product [Peniophora sp. CBMAI 1063]